MIRKNIQRSFELLLIIVFLIACAEEITEGNHSPLDVVFQTSVVDWNEEVYGDTENTRAISISDSLQVIPAFSDDGEEYALIVSTEKDTTSVPSTRTALTTNIKTGSVKFRAYAYINGDGVADQVLINGIERTIASDGSWLPNSGTTYEWPSPTQVINFYGIIPSSYTINTNDKTLTFTQSNAAANKHVDLLVASSEPLNRLKDASKIVNGVEVNNPIELKFKHALTAVQFKANKDLPTMTITEIRLKGFCNSGIYILPMGDGSGTWAANATTQDYTASATTTNGSVSSSTNDVLNADAQTFLMIPQSMASTKKLVLKVTATGGSSSTKYITANFNGAAAWKPGTLVKYTLSKKANVGRYLYTSYYRENGSHYTSIGARNEGTQYVSVTSFWLKNNSTTKEKQYWKVTDYSIGGSNNWKGTSPPVGTPFSITNNSGGDDFNKITIGGKIYGNGRLDLAPTASSSDYDFSIQKSRQKFVYSGPRLDQGVTMAGNTHSGTIDLSKYNPVTKQEEGNSYTSNCYIVNGVGSFKFPTVYGNAIQNGSVVSSTYSGFKSPWDNKDIATAYVHSKPSGASSKTLTAKILWIDSEIASAVSNPTYSNGYISFTVSKTSSGWENDAVQRLLPSNMVIGLCNGTEVLWQWHINFTTDTQSNRDLGRIHAGHRRVYSGGLYLYLKLQQVTASNGNTVVSDSPTSIIYFQYTGDTTDENTKYRSLNYNWGYPRPLPATGYTPSYPNGQTRTYPSEANNTGNTRWKDNSKTIFDPSPRGYRVPKYSQISNLTIGADEPFLRGWICSDGTVLSIPDGQSTGYYLTSTAASSTNYYQYYVNGAKTVNKRSVSFSSSDTKTGMVHPIAE